MNNADPQLVARAGMTVADRLQDFPADAQVMGVAALFLILAEASGVPAQDVFTATKNLMSNQEGRRPEFAALSDYVRNEL